jgi:hypothetical protein
MDPSMLHDDALRYELKIRGLKFESTRKGKILLQEALRKEIDEPASRPSVITTDLETELKDLLEFFELHVEELANLNLFKSGRDKDFNDRVYASLCHVEGRHARIDREKIAEAYTKQQFDDLQSKLDKIRQQAFNDRELYIKQDEAAREELKEMEIIKKRLDELMNKKSRCVRYEINYDQIIFDESDDESDDEYEEENEKVDKQHEIQQQKVEIVSQPMRSSSSDVIFGSHPPGHSNSGQNFVPRIPVPLFPSQPVPYSSANVYVGGDFWARQHRKSASLSTTFNRARNVGTQQRRNNESFLRANNVNVDQLWSDGFVRRSNEIGETWKKKHDAVVKKKPYDKSWKSDWYAVRTAVEAMQWLGNGSENFDCENAKIR